MVSFLRLHKDGVPGSINQYPEEEGQALYDRRKCLSAGERILREKRGRKLNREWG